MEKFLVIINSLIGVVVVLIGKLYSNVTRRVREVEDELKEIEGAFTKVRDDMQKMKFNYIDKFSTAKDERHEMRFSIMQSLNELHNKIDVHIAQRNNPQDNS